jgi:hypothetical protein
VLSLPKIIAILIYDQEMNTGEKARPENVYLVPKETLTDSTMCRRSVSSNMSSTQTLFRALK